MPPSPTRCSETRYVLGYPIRWKQSSRTAGAWRTTCQARRPERKLLTLDAVPRMAIARPIRKAGFRDDEPLPSAPAGNRVRTAAMSISRALPSVVEVESRGPAHPRWGVSYEDQVEITIAIHVTQVTLDRFLRRTRKPCPRTEGRVRERS